MELRTLVDPVIACLASAPADSDGTPYSAAIDYFVDVLSNFSGFLTEAHYDSIAALIASDWGQQRYEALLGGNYDWEYQMFAQFVLAYGDAKVQTLIESGEERHRKFLAMLCGLLGAPGYAVVYDTVFVSALEFWSTFVETMTDSLYSDNGTRPPWMQPALNIVMRAGGALLGQRSSILPSRSSCRGSPRSGRPSAMPGKTSADLLQTLYSLQGRPLVTLFVDLLLRSIPTRSWAEIESAAFCLAALSDCIADEDHCDDLLAKLFSSALFDLLALGEAHLPVRLRQTALSLIERYSSTSERHPEYLPASLNLLFDAVGTAALAAASSSR